MIKLQAALKDYLWGGEKLKTLFGGEKDSIIAESWEVSVHKDGESTISGTNNRIYNTTKKYKKLVFKKIFIYYIIKNKKWSKKADNKVA